jgi:hypothetical protein
MKFFSLLLILFLSGFYLLGQNSAVVTGIVSDNSGKPLEAATVAVSGTTSGTYTDKNGRFRLEVNPGNNITVAASFIGFKTQKIVTDIQAGENKPLNFQLERTVANIDQVVIEDRDTRSKTLTRIDPKTINVLPSAAGGVEAILKTLPGVSSNNELSNQYNVRGGNFDENLVYVNDIEIYRPLLIRSGQQEGLSFINPDMVSSILFSAGGFEARYGDKSASVLDIRYRKPTENTGNFSMSLLGGSLHAEGVTEGYRLTYQIGVRQKSNQYLLGAMETRGDYFPSFTDVQTFVTYDVTDKFELNFLGNISRNRFRMIPSTRQTDFGHVNEALRLTVYFDGQEIDDFNTAMGAFSGIWRPSPNLTLKLISSAFNTRETERFDIQGQYWLDELERDMGKDEFGEVAFNRGIGTYLNHTRNSLTANVLNLEHRGNLVQDNYNLQWGARAQSETINDQLSEWNMIDSAFYSIPRVPENNIYLQDVLRTTINLSSMRYHGFLQNSWFFGDETNYTFTAGVRSNYWTMNNQVLVSPRASFSIQPAWERDVLFRFAAGSYAQPPFYREMRALDGSINTNLKAQNSWHFIAAGDYNFTAWDRPFKFISELYYKHYTNLVPYQVDNVRLRYHAHNNARGYSTGVDFKVNGEFVPGIESWLSLSVMQTMEDILDDYFYQYLDASGNEVQPINRFNGSVTDSLRIEPGWIPRPTDQRMFFGMFFQDYLPRLPDFKMHLNFLFGTRLPFGAPNHQRYQQTLRMPPYRRVDIGFSYQIIDENKRPKELSPLRHLKTLWVSAEVLNLLDVNNVISYMWIKDDSNRFYAVPNYLTPRLLNVRITGRF